MAIIDLDAPSNLIDLDLSQPPEAESGLIGTVIGGAKQTTRAVGATADLVQQDLPELQESVAAQNARVKDPRLSAFEADLQERRQRLGDDPGWLDVIGAVGSAAWKNPMGAGLMTAEQLPNAAAVLGGAGAGAAAGSIFGPAGTVAGGLAGMFAGNLAIEGGSRTLEHVAKTDSLSDDDRGRLLKEGAVKAGVITGVDALTFGVSKWITGTARRAAETAAIRVAEQNGVAATEIAARRAADSMFDAAVASAEKLAVEGATTLGKRALQTGAAITLETVGEGAGEYLGEFAATGEADKMDAVIEAFSSLGQSAAEVAVASAWNKRGLLGIANAPDVDTAIAAATDAATGAIDEFKTGDMGVAGLLGAPSAGPTLIAGAAGVGTPEQMAAAAASEEQARLAGMTQPAEPGPTGLMSSVPIVGQPTVTPDTSGGRTDTTGIRADDLLIPDTAQPATEPLVTPQARVPSDIEAYQAAVAKQGTGALLSSYERAIVDAGPPSTPSKLVTEPARGMSAAEIVQRQGDRIPQQPMPVTQRQLAQEEQPVAAVTMATNANGVPVISTQSPEQTTALAEALKAAGLKPHTVNDRTVRVPKATPPAALQQAIDSVNTRFAEPRGQAAPVPTQGAQNGQGLQNTQTSPEAVNVAEVFGAGARLRTASEAPQPGERVGTVMRGVLTQLGRLTGTKVVFVSAEGADGATRAKDGNTVYINVRSSINPLQVMGHETTHVLKKKHREAWAAIRSAVESGVDDTALAEFARNYWSVASNAKKRGLIDDAVANGTLAEVLDSKPEWLTTSEASMREFLLDEMISDLGGERFSDPDFWGNVFQRIEDKHGSEKAKGIIQRLVAAIKELVAKFMMLARSKGFNEFNTESKVSPEQLKAVRDAIEAAYAQFISAERTNEPAGYVRGERAAAPAPGTQGEQDDEDLAELEAKQSPKRTSDVGHKRTKEGDYVGAPVGMTTAKLPALRNRLRQLAEEGKQGRMWYEESGLAILEAAEGSIPLAEKIAGLLAIYSPQATVSGNTSMGLKALYQWMNGQPIKARMAVQDAKAQAWMDGTMAEEDALQIKTGNFFRNLMRKIDESRYGFEKQGATIDMWMARVFGYNSKAIGSSARYGFAEREVKRLATELGWEPQQVQAALWVAIKSRIESIAGIAREHGQKQGWLKKVDRNGAVSWPPIDAEARDKYEGYILKLALSTEADPKGLASASYNFGTALQERVGQVSWEAMPGRTSGVLPGIFNATIEQQTEYLVAMDAALRDENGNDLIAAKLGLPVLYTNMGPSAWQMDVGAGAQTTVAVATDRDQKNKAVSVNPNARTLLNAYAAIRGYVLSQEAVVWHYPIFTATKKDANGVQIDISRDPTVEETRQLYQAIYDVTGRDDWAPAYVPGTGWRVLNFDESVANIDFAKQLKNVLVSLPNTFPASNLDTFKSDGDYISNDWKENSNGEGYRSWISGAGRSDLQGWVEGDLRDRTRRVEQEFAERYGWDRSRPDAASNGSTGASVASESQPRYGEPADRHAISVTGVHYSREQRNTLSSAYFGTGLKGQERLRVKEATDPRIKRRLYFYTSTGRGVTPEADVGIHAHSVELGNVYDMDVDPLRLYPPVDPNRYQSVDQRMNDFESAVLDAGYDGYATREFGLGGAAVLLGDHSVPVQYEGAGARPASAAMPAPRYSDLQLLRRRITENRALPSGQMTGAEWKRTLLREMPEVDPRWLDNEKLYRKGDLLKGAEELSVMEAVERAEVSYSPSRVPLREYDDMVQGGNIRLFNDTKYKITEKDADMALKFVRAGVSALMLDDAKIDVTFSTYSDLGGNLGLADKTQGRNTIGITVTTLRDTIRGMDTPNGQRASAPWLANLIAHELVHVRQFETGYFNQFNEKELDKYYRGKWSSRPWEKQAAGAERSIGQKILEDLVGQGVLHPDVANRNPLAPVQRSEVRQQADQIKAMSEDERDNLDPYASGMYRGYVLYEAEKMLPKKDGTFKSVNESNSFALWQEADAVVNVDGKPYLATKQEDPDDDADEGLYVWSFSDPAQPNADAMQTDWADKAEAVAQFRGTVSRSESRTPVYYSQLERAVSDAPARVFTTGKQVAAWLLSNTSKLGVKKEEIQWTGVTDWLETQGKVTQEQVAEYLKQGGVRVEEVVLRDTEDTPTRTTYQLFEDGELVSQGTETARDRWLARDPEADVREAIITDEQAAERAGLQPTKFSGHIPPGSAGGYREVLLTLPGESQYDKGELTKFQREMIDKYDSLNWKPLATDAENAKHDQIMARFDRRKEQFRSSHWDQPNVIAHLRTDTVAGANGDRLLRIIELQSDWAQKGRKEGFNKQRTTKPLARGEYAEFMAVVRDRAAENIAEKLGGDMEAARSVAVTQPFEDVARFAGMSAEFAEITARQDDDVRALSNPSIPSAPFVTDTKSWVALALKRAIRMAVDGDYDGVVFATGQQNADLYDLSKQIDKVHYRSVGAAADGVFHVVAIKGESAVWSDKTATISVVEDTLGKEIAQKIKDGVGDNVKGLPDTKSLTGLDLKVGGEGMRAFYDQIVPQVANDVLKKLGAGVKVGDIDTGSKLKSDSYIVKHPEFRDEYAVKDEISGKWLAGLRDSRYPIWVDAGRSAMGFTSESDAMRATDKFQDMERVQLQPGFPLTDALRAAAAQPMPLFSESRATVNRWAYKNRQFVQINDQKFQNTTDAEFARLVAGFDESRDPELMKATFPAMAQPNVLQMLGLPNQWLGWQADIIAKIRSKHKVFLPGDKLNELLRSPAIVMRSRDDIEVISDYMIDGEPLMFALAVDVLENFGLRPGENLRETKVKSAYPLSWNDKVVDGTKQTGFKNRLLGAGGRKILYADQVKTASLFPRVGLDTEVGSSQRANYWAGEIEKRLQKRMIRGYGDLVNWIDDRYKGEPENEPLYSEKRDFSPDDIITNPSASRLEALLRLSRDKTLRYVVDQDGDFHFWDAWLATHKAGADAAGVPYDYRRRGIVTTRDDMPAFSFWDDGLSLSDMKRYMTDNALFPAPGQYDYVTGTEIKNIMATEDDALLSELASMSESREISAAELAADRAAEKAMRDLDEFKHKHSSYFEFAHRTRYDGTPYPVDRRLDGEASRLHRIAIAANKVAADLEYAARRFNIRESTPRSQIPQMWQDTSLLGTWDNLARKLQDKQIDTKRIVAAIREAGIAIKDKFDPYLQETLFHGRAATAVNTFLDSELKPLYVEMAARGFKTKADMREFDDYLWARHATERNAQIARIDSTKPDGGSGLTNVQAADVLAGRAVTVQGRTIQLQPARMASYAALAQRVDRINKNTTDLLVSSGLESQATVDKWRATYKHYAPLMRDMESDDNYLGAFNLGMGTGQGFNVKGSSSKRATGSDRDVVDVLANIAMQRERAITRAEKNKVSTAVYGLALTATNPEFWLPINPDSNNPALQQKVEDELVNMGLSRTDAAAIAKEPTQTYTDKNGMVAQRVNPQLRGRDNVLALRVNGQDRYVFFSSDERATQMVRNLKNLDNEQMGEIMSHVAKVTRYFSSINTQFNPVFGLTNGIRDLGTGMLNLSSTPLKGQRARVLKYAWDALRGIYSDLRIHRKHAYDSMAAAKAGLPPPVMPQLGAWATDFEEFAREGGQTGYRDMFATSKDRAEAIAKEIQNAGKGKSWVALDEKRSPIFGWLSDYNTSIENAIRLAAYKVAKEDGQSVQQAANIAKNLTVNFNKKGLAATQAGAMYAFFNAAVQGTARIGATMVKRDTTTGKVGLTDAGKKIAYGGVMFGAMQALMMSLAGYDDEEPPQFIREKSIIVPMGYRGKYLSLPMPLGFHVIANLGRIPTEFMLAGFKKPGDRLVQLFRVIGDGFNPIGSSTLLQMVTPTIVDPLAALAENKDWSGKSIYKEDFNKMEPTAGWTRKKDTASDLSKWLSYSTNYITGGGKYGIGIASPTPDQIDYLIGQATGGVGRESLKLWQAAKTPLTGEALPMYKIPVAGRFVGNTTGQESQASKFYDNLKRIGEHDSALKEIKRARDSQAYAEYMRENPDARQVKMADKASRDVSLLKKQKREALEKGDSGRVALIERQLESRIGYYNKVLSERGQ